MDKGGEYFRSAEKSDLLKIHRAVKRSAWSFNRGRGGGTIRGIGQIQGGCCPSCPWIQTCLQVLACSPQCKWAQLSCSTQMGYSFLGKRLSGEERRKSEDSGADKGKLASGWKEKKEAGRGYWTARKWGKGWGEQDTPPQKFCWSPLVSTISLK